MGYPISCAAVQELAGWSPLGDVIDHQWGSHIRKTTDSGQTKPYDLALRILARIVYFHRITPVYDELTGTIKSWEQKFQADLWQVDKSFFAEQFDVSEKNVQRALAALETVGVIVRHTRDIYVGSRVLQNVTFLELNTHKLKQISTPKSDPAPTGGQNCPPVETKPTTGRDKIVHTTNMSPKRSSSQKSSSSSAPPAAAISPPRRPKPEDPPPLAPEVGAVILQLPTHLQGDARQIAHEELAPPDIITSNYLLCLKKIKAGKEITGGHLRQAVRQDWAAGAREEAARKQEEKAAREEERLRQAEEEAARRQVEDEEYEHRKQEALAAFQVLAPDIQQLLQAEARRRSNETGGILEWCLVEAVGRYLAIQEAA